METKVLYSNADVTITALAVLPIERLALLPIRPAGAAEVEPLGGLDAATKRVERKLLYSDPHSAMKSLSLPESGGELRSLLYIGCDDSTLVSLRCVVQRSPAAAAAAPSSDQPDGYRVAMLPHAKVHLDEGSVCSDDGPVRHSRSITSILASPGIPLLFVVLGGTARVLHTVSLEVVSNTYLEPLQLGSRPPIHACCVAKDQEYSKLGTSVGVSESGVDGEGHEDASGGFSSPHRVALLLGSTVVALVRCTRSGAFFLHDQTKLWSGTTAGKRDSASSFLPVPEGTSCLIWQADTIVTGSLMGYCVFDAITTSLCFRLSVGSQRAPFLEYVCGSGGLWWDEYAGEASGSGTRHEGNGDKDGAAARLSVWEKLSGAVAHTASTTMDDSSSNCEGIDEWNGEQPYEGLMKNGQKRQWPCGVVFRTGSALRVCDCRHGSDSVDFSSAPPLIAAHGDDKGLGEIERCYGLPPFLFGIEAASQSARGGGGADERAGASWRVQLLSCMGGERWIPLAPTSPSQIGGDSSGITEGIFSSEYMTGFVTFPLGLLGFSPHTVEVALLKPTETHVDALVENGLYVRALRYLNLCLGDSRCFYNVNRPPSIVNDNPDGDGDDGDAETEQFELEAEEARATVCERCAADAWRRAQYAVALELYGLAGTPIRKVLREHCVELLATIPDYRAGTAETFEKQHDAAHVALYAFLMHRFYWAVQEDMMSEHEVSPISSTTTASSVASVEQVERQSIPLETAASNAAPVTSPRRMRRGTEERRALEFAIFRLLCIFSEDYVDALFEKEERESADSNDGSVIHSSAGNDVQDPTAGPLYFITYARYLPMKLCTGLARSSRPRMVPLLLSLADRSADAMRLCRTSCCRHSGLPSWGTATDAVLSSNSGTSCDGVCNGDGEANEASRWVRQAGRVLRVAPLSQSLELYREHFTWMVATDSSEGVAALTLDPHRPSFSDVFPVLMSCSGVHGYSQRGEAAEPFLYYLRFLVYSLGERDGLVHTTYACHLANMVKELHRVAIGTRTPEAEAAALRVPAGEEAGVLGKLRAELLAFLVVTPPRYDIATVLHTLRELGLGEEQEAVAHAAGDYIGVLIVLVYVLDDVEGAQQYCVEQHRLRCASASRENLRRRGTLRNYCGSEEVLRHGTGKVSGQQQQERTGEINKYTGETICSSPNSKSGTWAADAPPLTPLLPTLPSSYDDEEEEEPVRPGGTLRFPTVDCLTHIEQEMRTARVYTTLACANDAVIEEEDEDNAGESPGAAGVDVGRRGDHIGLAEEEEKEGAAAYSDQRFNTYLHALLNVLLVPPHDGAAPRLQDALRVLDAHSFAINPLLLLQCLPAELPLAAIAPYLSRALRTAELDVYMSEMEAVAAEAALDTARQYHARLQERCVWVDSHRRCPVCHSDFEGKDLLAVFPNLKVTHFRCHGNPHLDPERGVPFSDVL